MSTCCELTTRLGTGAVELSSLRGQCVAKGVYQGPGPDHEHRALVKWRAARVQTPSAPRTGFMLQFKPLRLLEGWYFLSLCSETSSRWLRITQLVSRRAGGQVKVSLALRPVRFGYQAHGTAGSQGNRDRMHLFKTKGTEACNVSSNSAGI